MYPTDIAATSNNSGLVTISFFKYTGKNVLWALSEMHFAKKPLSETPGLTFYKLMGSGGGDGFSLKPDFNVYALIGIWKTKEYAKNFFRTSKVFRGFKDHCQKCWTLQMEPIKTKGKWNKINPFLPLSSDLGYDGKIAVLTRATISTKHLFSFWNSVPGVSEILKMQDGLIFSKGLGEYPLFQQATFSIWENKRALHLFAYHSQKHKEVIDKTHAKGWYKEDLFTEFKILETEGEWEGINFSFSEEEKRRSEAIHDILKQSLSEKSG